MNLPSIKRAGSPHYTVIRLKTSFCSATYRPKAHRPIYRDLGALVHSKYLHPAVRHIALIVGTWSRSYPQGPRENNKAAPDASSGDGMIVRSDAPILRKQQTEARNPVLSLRNRKFESTSLQRRVKCEPDFRGSSRGQFGSEPLAPRAVSPAPISRIYTGRPCHTVFLNPPGIRYEGRIGDRHVRYEGAQHSIGGISMTSLRRTCSASSSVMAAPEHRSGSPRFEGFLRRVSTVS